MMVTANVFRRMDDAIATDDQRELRVRLFRGAGPSVQDATPLGEFVVAGFPALPRGEVQLILTLRARGRDLELSGIESTTSSPLEITLARQISSSP